MAKSLKILQNIKGNSEDFLKIKFYLQNNFRFLKIFLKKTAFYEDNLKNIFSEDHSPCNHEWNVKTRVLIVSLQLKYDKILNNYLIQLPAFLVEVESEKKIPLTKDWINSLILREYQKHINFLL